METTITGFHHDAEGDWVAELACGHGQHMRHRPPWILREWVVTADGRAGKVGESIDCPLCDRIAMPPGGRGTVDRPMSEAARSGRSLRPLVDGGRYFEGPRWHADRLWVADTIARSVYTVDLAGRRTRVCEMEDIVCGLGNLPNGTVVVLGMFQKRLWRLSDGIPVLHADLSATATGTIDDMIVDGRGNAYVGDLGFDLLGPARPRSAGRILLVAPDGSARVVAEDLDFPNGIAVSADATRLVVAESAGDRLSEFRIEPDGSLSARRSYGHFAEPDGVCLDRNGDAWVALFSEDAFVRVTPSGEIAERIPTPGRRAIACCLGGKDRRTLFCITAETTHEDLMQGRSTSRIETAEVDVPGAGAP